MCQISHQKLVLDTMSSSIKEPVIIGMYTVEVRDGSQDRPFSYLKTCQYTMTLCLSDLTKYVRSSTG